MAKKKASKSFDPDALEKAGQEIVKKHQERENTSPPKSRPTPPVAKVKETKTKMVRIRPSYHKRLKRAALEADTSIQGFVEKLIDENIA